MILNIENNYVDTDKIFAVEKIEKYFDEYGNYGYEFKIHSIDAAFITIKLSCFDEKLIPLIRFDREKRTDLAFKILDEMRSELVLIWESKIPSVVSKLELKFIV